MGITSVTRWADESKEKGYSMWTNRLSNTNGSTNALNLICCHQQWGSTGSMVAMMIITNQNRRIHKTIYILIGSWKICYMCESTGKSAKIADAGIANK